MKTLKRAMEGEVQALARQFRALCIVGPRQSGKSTLCRRVFRNKPYVSLEDPGVQAQAEVDIASFLNQYRNGAVLDEVQRVPDILRHLQGRLDSRTTRGQFVLTGSSNYLLQHQVSQSLAGRVGYLELLPLSFAELQSAGLALNDVNLHIFRGGYPELWQHPIDPEKWMASYVRTYIQRDVRLIRNITDLGRFTRFVQLVATYAGQLVNRDAIGAVIGVDTKTVLSWLSVLESSYVVYLLQPYHSNLNKRIVKTPKLYFYDTGLLCYLLNLTSASALAKSDRYGPIFENWVITEIRKNLFNKGMAAGMYYFRDSGGNEVDLILEKQGNPIAVEVKASRKFNSDMQAGIRYWQKYNRGSHGILIARTGRSHQLDTHTYLMDWKEIGSI